jgi:hypothetical protein
MASRSTAPAGPVSFAIMPPAKRRRRPVVAKSAGGATKARAPSSSSSSSTDRAHSLECVPSLPLTRDDERQLAADCAAELDVERGLDVYRWLAATAPAVAHAEPVSGSSHADKDVAFVLHLQPQFFSINNQPTPHAYTHATMALLQAIDAGRLPPDVQDMLEDIACPFYDGGVVVELCDYRGLPPAHLRHSQNFNGEGVAPRVRRVMLRPDGESIVDDVNRIWNAHKTAHLQWGPEQYVAIEQRLLHAIAPPLCLDPSPFVGHALAVLHYNRLKMNYRAPDYLRPAMAERANRRVLTHFLLARDVAGTTRASRRAPPVNQLSLPVPPPAALPPAELLQTPAAVAAEAHQRIAAHLMRTASISVPPGAQLPPTQALLTNRRQLQLQGDSSALFFKAIDNPIGGYEGLVRITAPPDEPSNSDQLVRFSLGSLSEAVAFVTQLRALCKRRDAFALVSDSNQQSASAPQQQQPQQQQTPQQPQQQATQ